MSQTTADDLFQNLGMTPANESASKSADTQSSPSRRKHAAIVIVSALALAAGFKMLGDYAADRAIDACSARQNAQYSYPEPETLKLFEAMQREESTAQESPTPTDPTAVSVRE